jgi:arylsulfatase A-like enzyme
MPNGIAVTPVCTPSRATLLTGRWAVQTRCYTNGLSLPEDIPTFARSLTSVGYRCGWIGKWHLDGMPWEKFTPPGPRRAGFDDYWATMNCRHKYFEAAWFEDDPVVRGASGYEPFVQTELAETFIRTRAGSDAPWCLALAWGPPHEPYEQVPRDYRAQVDPLSLRLRPNVADLAEPWIDRPSLAPDLRAIADYYAACRALDDAVGQLLSVLRETGQEENTIVVFSSDHGDQLWGQGRRGKLTPYTESTTVPLVWRWPAGLPTGAVSDAVTALPDVPVTLLSLAGAPPLAGATGRDVSPALRGDGAGPEVALISQVVAGVKVAEDGRVTWRESSPEWRGVRTATHTYARTLDGPWMLFDDVADPYQLTNLVGDEALVSEYDDLLVAELARTGEGFADSASQLVGDGLVEPFLDELEQWGLARSLPLQRGAAAGLHAELVEDL